MVISSCFKLEVQVSSESCCQLCRKCYPLYANLFNITVQECISYCVVCRHSWCRTVANRKGQIVCGGGGGGGGVVASEAFEFLISDEDEDT